MTRVFSDAVLWDNDDVRQFKYAYVRWNISEQLMGTYVGIFTALDEPWMTRIIQRKTMHNDFYDFRVIYTNLSRDDLLMNLRLRDSETAGGFYVQVASQYD